MLRGETLLADGNLDDASEDAAWLMERFSDAEEVLMLNGRLEKAKGNAEKAMETFSHVIDINPFSIEAYSERAAIKQEQGDTDGYEEDMKKVAEMTPESDEEDIEEKTKQAYKNNNPFGI